MIRHGRASRPAARGPFPSGLFSRWVRFLGLLLLTSSVLVGCGDGTAPTGGGVPPPPPASQVGDLRVTTETVGDEQDSDGYSLVVDGQPGIAIGSNAQLTVRGLAEGFHSFLLDGIAENCRVTNVDQPMSVAVSVDQTNTLTFVVFCLAPDSGMIYYIESPGLTISSMNAIGGDRTRIEASPGDVHAFAVSPNGDRIAYTHGPGAGLWDIYTMDVDGSNRVQLTGLAGPFTGRDVFPAWSPDGLRIAYQSGRDFAEGELHDIFVMSANGKGRVNITNSPSAWDRTPAWSPDGTRIAFSSDRQPSRSIYVMNPDGGDVRPLTTGTQVGDWYPEWSPDGSQIAFSKSLSQAAPNLGTPAEIFVMNADGTGLEQLTDFGPQFEALSADWSPDGGWIVFYVIRAPCCQTVDIYVMRKDGTDLVRLLSGGGEPDWVQ